MVAPLTGLDARQNELAIGVFCTMCRDSKDLSNLNEAPSAAQ